MASAFGTSYRFRAPGTAGTAARWSVALHALALAVGGVASIVFATGDGEWRLGPATTTSGGAWAFGPMIGPMRFRGRDGLLVAVWWVAFLAGQVLA